MIKVTCDRCDKPAVKTLSIGAGAEWYEVTVTKWWAADVSSGADHYDFCISCQQDIGKYALKKVKK